MNLVKQRDEWSKLYYYGENAPEILEQYRKHRDSENWRTSMIVEQLCEYILNLEEMIYRSLDK